jgi:hypothetical protein
VRKKKHEKTGERETKKTSRLKSQIQQMRRNGSVESFVKLFDQVSNEKFV